MNKLYTVTSNISRVQIDDLLLFLWIYQSIIFLINRLMHNKMPIINFLKAQIQISTFVQQTREKTESYSVNSHCSQPAESNPAHIAILEAGAAAF